MGLDRGLVVRTALELLNEVGLEGLTLRRIARELDVQAPALYWHFKNKQELLDEMATTLLRDALADTGRAPDPEQPWQAWLLDYGRWFHRLLLGYRDGAKMYSGTYLTDDSLLNSMEGPLRKLVDAGFGLRQATVGLATITHYTVGFTIEEQAVHPRPGERNEQYDLDRRAARIDAGAHPLALAAGEEMFTGFDENFEDGLGLLVAGLEQSLTGAPSRPLDPGRQTPTGRGRDPVDNHRG